MYLRWLWVAFAVVVVAIILLGVASAHDREHPELNSWFMSLRSEGGGYCCDGQDATHVADADWRTKDGHYQVRINQYQDGSGQYVWVDVPDGAVIKEPNKDGRTLVWPIWGNQPSVRCFLPGAGS